MAGIGLCQRRCPHLQGCEVIARESPTDSYQPNWRWSLGVLLALLTITLLMSHPLALHLTTAVPGWVWNDNAEYVWKLWWLKHTILDQGRSPFWVPHIFYPFGYSLANSELSFSQTLPALAITLAFGSAAAYNILALSSFVLTGFAAYLWLTWLTHDRWAGLLAGILFAYVPYRYHMLGGQLPLLGTQWMPLVFLYLERTLRCRHLREAALLGLFYGLNALASWYYAAIVGLLAILYALARAHPWRESLTDHRLWACALVALTTALGLIGPAAWPYLQTQTAGGLTHPLSETDQWSASLTDYLVPSMFHPLWGPWVAVYLTPTTELWRAFEFVLAWGFVASLLALYGWRWGPRPLTRTLVITAGLAVLFSLGTTLHLHGRPLRMPVPLAVARAFNDGLTTLCGRGCYDIGRPDAVPVPLPSLLLYLLVPPFRGLRVWSRFGVVADLMVAALAGLGLAVWRRRQKTSSWAVTAGSLLFMALVLFEFWPIPYQLYPTTPRPVDGWLAGQPGDFAIIQLPYAAALNGQQLLYSRYHGKNVAGGYGSFFPPEFTEHEADLRAFPADESLDLLRAWRVRYVLIGADDFNGWPDLARRIAAQPRLSLAYDDGTIRAYEVLP